jgi:hypothetical protein
MHNKDMTEQNCVSVLEVTKGNIFFVEMKFNNQEEYKMQKYFTCIQEGIFTED